MSFFRFVCCTENPAVRTDRVHQAMINHWLESGSFSTEKAPNLSVLDKKETVMDVMVKYQAAQQRRWYR